MFVVKTIHLDLFLDAVSLFTDIVNDQICLKFSPSTFSINARYQSPLFFATMFMPPPLFTVYSIDRVHVLRVSLWFLHTALVIGQTFASLSIGLLEDRSLMLLAFKPSRPSRRPMYRKLGFEVPVEDWSPGQVDFGGKSFSIESDLFRDIISTFYDYNEADTIFITSVGSKVSFSVANPFYEVIITEECGECLILGNGEIEIEMRIPLRPSSFFINFPHQAQRVWFFKSTDASTIIKFPFHVYAHFLMIRCPFVQN